MNSTRSQQRASHAPTPGKRLQDRKGGAAVELTVMAPLFVALVMGAVQSGMNLDMQIKIQAAIRQAGRLAAMDYSKRLQPGQTGNQKVIQDIKNVLIAEGLPGNDATITITHADGPNAGSTFDLASSANDLQLFKIQIEIPYSALNSDGLLPNVFNKLTAAIVYRREKIVSI